MEPQFIVNTPLPVTQDFKMLKEEALAFVQEFGGYEWTNLNTSDPGVTIIDQLCYALTELGYCTDFSIEDILTDAKGELKLQDQFYLPEDILTTAPVTFNDYRKYLIDRIPGLRNVLFYAENHTFYQTYLAARNKQNSTIETESFYTLNSSRNLNELFLLPKKMKTVTRVLVGKLEIEQENKLSSILIAINTVIEEYIFPSVQQVAYETLVQQGIETNEIFNGPLLQHGWITTEALGAKASQVAINDLANLILSVPGVQAVSGLNYEHPAAAGPLKIDELLQIDLSGLVVTCKGKPLKYSINSALNKTKTPDMKVVLGAAVNIQTELPTGKYRDINDYYSIQNTFPEIFGIGESADSSNATKFQTAQSRQLKGYLTLFDQVLANQFAQVANLDKLFSFKNSMSGNPSDVYDYYVVKDAYQKQHLTSPVPYLSFSPTYYFQSLYHTPHIRPLLKDNNMFRLMDDVAESSKEVERDSWVAYKQDAYNPYIRGLMEFTQDEEIDLSRRNAILDHLLARHGESPLLMDTIVEGIVYTGDQLKDQVIIKSLYLQNLGLLSYYRQKAYNFLAAQPLKALNVDAGVDLTQSFFNNDTRDFIFMAEEVDRAAQLHTGDFVNYSALELKLSLLFGLNMQYKNYLINTAGMLLKEEVQVLLWMIQQRKGIILLETNLLWQQLNFDIILKIGNTHWQVDQEVTFKQLLDIHDFLIKSEEVLLQFVADQAFIEIEETQYPLKQVLPGADSALSAQNCICSITIHGGDQLSVDQLNLVLNNSLLLIFPSFLESPAFSRRLEVFLTQALPVSNNAQWYFEALQDLKNLIYAFTTWHNSLIFKTEPTPEMITAASVQLANEILKLKTASV